MKIKRAQGFHPRRVKFDFHTNPDERPSNGLSEAKMKIKRAQGFHPRRVKFDFHTIFTERFRKKDKGNTRAGWNNFSRWKLD
jgi:hypothetical protein